MEVLHAKARKWGNSVGVILPSELGINPDEEILLQVTRLKGHGKVKDIFGLLSKKSDTRKIMDELNEEFS